MNTDKLTGQDIDALYTERYAEECVRVNRIIYGLMLGQWIIGIGLALFYSPNTWIGEFQRIHVHVWAAVLLGGSISGLAILNLWFYPTATRTRHVVAIAQVLWSALFIHLSGGRIETHFHVFASLAILSAYRDWRVLITATVVVALDHAIRGIWYPLSVFGVATISPFRWIEHAAWVLFEVGFLVPACIRLRGGVRELCRQQTELKDGKLAVEMHMSRRTRDLNQATTQLALKTREAELLSLVATHTDNAVIITDRHGVIELVNNGFCSLTNYSVSEVAGRPALDLLFGPNTNPATVHRLKDALNRGVRIDCEVVVYSQTASHHWVAMEWIPVSEGTTGVDRFVCLAKNIDARITAHTQREEMQRKIMDASRRAGIAEIATGVLHNVGNVLNSVNVSANMLANRLRGKREEQLLEAAGIINDNRADLAGFFEYDPRGKHFPEFFEKTATCMLRQKTDLQAEVDSLIKNVDYANEIVSMQQSQAKNNGLKQKVMLSYLIEESLRINENAMRRHGVKVVRNYHFDVEVFLVKNKILQILFNLINNAKDALNRPFGPGEVKTITLSTEAFGSGQQVGERKTEGFRMIVEDNGIGIARENLVNIFKYGYTTKEHGHGFGLHSCSNAAAEMGGTLTVQSEGVNRGSRFILELPSEQPQRSGTKTEPLQFVRNSITQPEQSIIR